MIVYGPGFFKFDVTLAKKFSLGESRSLEIRALALDALNHPNFRTGGFNADVLVFSPAAEPSDSLVPIPLVLIMILGHKIRAVELSIFRYDSISKIKAVVFIAVLENNHYDFR